jgi:hypothetical protein
VKAVHELAVGNGWAGGRAAEQEAGEIGDAAAAIEAVVPLARVAWQMLGADAVEGAVEPALHVAEESSGSIRRPCKYIDGDTDRVAFGIGTNGSRSTVVGGSALWMAADKVIAKANALPRILLEAAAADIEFADSNFSIAGTDRRVSMGVAIDHVLGAANHRLLRENEELITPLIRT